MFGCDIDMLEGSSTGTIDFSYYRQLLLFKTIEREAYTPSNDRCFTYSAFESALALNGWDAVQQALVKQADAFSDRPNFLSVLNLFKPHPAIGIFLRSNTHQLKTLRRFTLQTLEDFGVRKSSIEERIAVEINATCTVFEVNEGELIEITHMEM